MTGRIKTKLASILTAALRDQGHDVVDADPEHLYEALGYNRSSPQADIYRWSTSVPLRGSALTVRVDSYTTMTKIVRSKGMVLDKDERMALTYYAYDATGN